MTSESKSGGTSQPPEEQAPPARRVPPYDPDLRLITYWEARDKPFESHSDAEEHPA